MREIRNLKLEVVEGFDNVNKGRGSKRRQKRERKGEKKRWEVTVGDIT
jgi:hypothetical protein